MKIATLLILLFSATNLIAERTPQSIAHSLCHNTEKKAVAASSIIYELNGSIYTARAKLEIALKRVDDDFTNTHNEYDKLRQKYQKNTSSQEKKQAYYIIRRLMIKELLSKAAKEAKVTSELGNYKSAVETFRTAVAKSISANERIKYKKSCNVLDKSKGLI